MILECLMQNLSRSSLLLNSGNCSEFSMLPIDLMQLILASLSELAIVEVVSAEVTLPGGTSPNVVATQLSIKSLRCNRALKFSNTISSSSILVVSCSDKENVVE